MRTSRRETAITHAVLVLAAAVAVYPFVSIMLRALAEPGTPVIGGLPDGVHLGSFTTAWDRRHFASALTSSALVSASVVVATDAMAVLAGFALASMRVPGAKVIMGLLLVGLVIPYEVTVVPLYELLRGWGLIDTYWALILPQVALSMPLGVFWMRTFYAALPAELYEAARVDGASRLQSLRLVALPISGSALATLSTILFLFTWNEFLLALVLVPQNEAVQTAPLALSFFSGAGRHTDPAVTAAAAVLVALPVLVTYVFLQRRLITGIVDGAVK